MLLLLACTQTPGFGKPDTDVDTGDTADTDTHDTDPVETGDTDGDLDDDGYTPEEGDCDDNDVHVSPVRPEDDDDGIDNDCDGRVDEKFSGVDVAYANGDGSSSIVTIDTIGRLAGTVRLDNDCYPYWLDHLGDDGWVINNGYVSIATVDSAGTCTDIGDFSDSETYEYGVWGVATGLDGTIYAVTIGSLVTVGLDGTITELASWTVDFEDPAAHELAASGLAVDSVTGEIGLFDYFGGFATWSPENGLQILKKGDYEAPDLYTFTGAHRDGGGWYAPAVSTGTGAYGVYRWADTDWELQDEWADEDWEPFMLTIDGDSGDAYVTANAGWFYTVWRVIPGSGFADDLYVTDGTEHARAFNGITANY